MHVFSVSIHQPKIGCDISIQSDNITDNLWRDIDYLSQSSVSEYLSQKKPRLIVASLHACLLVDTRIEDT